MRSTADETDRQAGDRSCAGDRSGAIVLVLAGASFVAYPLVRPRGDDLAAMASTAWLVSHLCAMAGFVLLVGGLDAVRTLVPGAAARAAALVTGLGAAAVLPYYGAEDFALHAAGGLALVDPGAAVALAPLPDAFRLAPVPGTVFVLGLLGLAIGSVLAAISLWRSAARSPAGLPLAAGGVLFLPQFFAPPEWRVAHGMLLGAGCVAVATVVARRSRHGSVAAAGPPADR